MKNYSVLARDVNKLSSVRELAKKVRNFVHYIPGRIFFCMYMEHSGCSDFDDELDYWVKLQKYIDRVSLNLPYLRKYLYYESSKKNAAPMIDASLGYQACTNKLNSQAQILCDKIFQYEYENYNPDWQKSEQKLFCCHKM